MLVEKCQKQLALLWFIWSAFLFMYLFVQMAGGFFGEKNPPIAEIFGWFFSNTLPFLSLITSIMVLSAIKSKTASQPDAQNADAFWYKITLGISVFYLIVLSIVPILPAIALFELTPLKFMQNSTALLGPLQGIATASLGAFFFKSK